jgi:hypothetical protein
MRNISFLMRGIKAYEPEQAIVVVVDLLENAIY